jgi:hypothetical protein
MRALTALVINAATLYPTQIAIAQDWRFVPNGAELNYCVDVESIERHEGERIFSARECGAEDESPVRYRVDCTQTFERPVRIRTDEPPTDDLYFDDSPGFAAARFVCEVSA